MVASSTRPREAHLCLKCSRRVREVAPIARGRPGFPSAANWIRRGPPGPAAATSSRASNGHRRGGAVQRRRVRQVPASVAPEAPALPTLPATGRMKGIVDNLLLTTYVIQIFNDLPRNYERLIDISLMSSDNRLEPRRRFPSYPQDFPHVWISQSVPEMVRFLPRAALLGEARGKKGYIGGKDRSIRLIIR